MKKIKKEEEIINLQPDYTEEEIAYRQDLIQKLTTSDTAKSSTHRELNDMTHQEYYDSNVKAANSYIPPKKNPEDTRIVTGTTEEKENTLISSILNYNLESNILAFDKDMLEVDELGRNMEDMIKKSRELENYDEKRVLIYKELMDQGSCFVEEQWVEENKIVKKLKNINWGDGINVKKISWDEKIEDGFIGCQTRLIRGDKVYLGNIKEFQISKQPYLFTVDILSYEEAKAIYGKWDRFKYVPKKIVRVHPTDNSTYRDWTLETVQENFVEVIKYQNKWCNEYMIILNGVMMLPCGFPLEVVSPSGEYTIAKGDIYPISQFFAYSKSIPAKTKVDQEVLDEMLKLIVLKTRKSFMPPLANNTGRVLSRKIMNAGEITNQLDPNKIQVIGDATGVSSSEFAAFEFIKNIIDQKSVSPTFMGETQSGRQTATEILELKKQQMMKLGMVIFGIISLEKQLAWLRIYNILTNWTKVQEKKYNDITQKLEDVYKTIEVDTEMEDTQSGKKIIEFNPNVNQYSPEQIMEEEEQLSQVMRKPVRKTYMSPDIAKMKYFWYITINPTERNSSDLERVMFKQDIQDAITLFGPQTLNYSYLMKRYAVLTKQNPEKFFNKSVPAQPTDAALGGGDQGGLGAQLNRGLGTSMMGQ
jgi:tRNA splicing endonuclease